MRDVNQPKPEIPLVSLGYVISGDVLESECSAVVLPASTVGELAAGIAQRWPDLAADFANHCKLKDRKTGSVFLWWPGVGDSTEAVNDNPLICLALVRTAPNQASAKTSVKSAVRRLAREELPARDVASVAVAPLGYDQLDDPTWGDLLSMVAFEFGRFSTATGARVDLYDPFAAVPIRPGAETRELGRKPEEGRQPTHNQPQDRGRRVP